MRLEEVMTRLYQAEINCSISCFWDGGWDVKLGDAVSGYKAELCVDTPAEVAECLWEVALSYYPVLGFDEWVGAGADFTNLTPRQAMEFRAEAESLRETLSTVLARPYKPIIAPVPVVSELEARVASLEEKVSLLYES